MACAFLISQWYHCNVVNEVNSDHDSFQLYQLDGKYFYTQYDTDRTGNETRQEL